MIHARNLTKNYKKTPAVRGISLDVQQGEIFGLVGPDGAGKTTIIQLLTGILTPTSGAATVAGVDVVNRPADLGGKIGYMSAGFTLYGALSVEENLNFFADLYGVPAAVRQERKAQLLAFARLEGARNRRAEHLSGGMKKKLALACTLMYSPQILFLDEPTTGVDPVSRRDFWKILFEWMQSNEGLTIFVSTPYLDEAERFDRVALMHQGSFIAVDTPTALKKQLSGTMMAVNAQPQRAALEQLKKTAGVSHVQVFGEQLRLLLAENSAVNLAETLEQAGARVLEARPTSPTLEDVFVSSIETAGSAAVFQANGNGPLAAVTPISSQYAVTVQNLTKTFGNFTAVNGLDFTVRPGEIFGFLGPNGSGKTTTIRMLTGLLPPTAGSGTVAGFDILRQQKLIKPHIGYMSQKFSLYNDLTVVENIDFYAGVYNVPRKNRRERKAWVLDMAGLRGKERALTGSLSGGWKQRLALGCAILHQPQILFLDEPTSGVDPISRRAFWDLIFELSAQGVTIFVTTHYMDEAEHCHTLGLLYYGDIIAMGAPPEVKQNMKAGEMVEIEIAHPLRAAGILEKLPGVQSAAPYGDKLHAMVWGRAADHIEMLEKTLTAAELPPARIETIEFSLEDLFVIFIEMKEAGRRAREEGLA